jgi:hypothetical protein
LPVQQDERGRKRTKEDERGRKSGTATVDQMSQILYDNMNVFGLECECRCICNSENYGIDFWSSSLRSRVNEDDDEADGGGS